MKTRAPSRHLLALCIVAMGMPVLAAHSESDSFEPASQAGPIEEIVVFGRNADLVGTADSASEGFIAGADLLIRPLVRTAELLESMPGMVAVQHSGSGKANQYFLRGFNLDHGTDYSVYVDDMPLNMRSHGHGQGYLDVNGLIPESVARIDFRKGPYRPELGDFSMAGASMIQTIELLDRPFVSAELGESGWQRYVAGISNPLMEGTLTLIGEYKQYDGPWAHEEDLKHVALWSKYRVDTAIGELSLTLSGYDADWEPTEQIPERAIGSNLCRDEFCGLDPTAQGSTKRWIANGQLAGKDWNASLYAQFYDWSMSSNPTYDAQINQFDKRWIFGGKMEKALVDSTSLELQLGGEFRLDDVSTVGLDQFDGGRFVSNISENQLQEHSLGIYLDGAWHATDALRLMAGVRYDWYDFDVSARSPSSFAGRETDSRVSPKLGAAYKVTDDLELYGNWGKGFHSNDARGVVNGADPVPGLSPGEGYELGVRTGVADFKITAAYWWLNQDSELIFIGDSNSVEPKGGSEREGFELTMFWQPLDWLALDLVATNSKARFTDSSQGSRVEGAVEKSGQVGVTLTRTNWDASMRLRYLGPYALVADDSQRADSLTTVNLRAARHWDALTLFAEVINLFDTDGKEISYYYPAYVAGLDPSGLSSETLDCDAFDCHMSRVTEPRAIRAGVKYEF